MNEGGRRLLFRTQGEPATIHLRSAALSVVGLRRGSSLSVGVRLERKGTDFWGQGRTV